MRLFIKHLATWLLLIYLVCAFTQWDLCVLQSMERDERGLYIFLSVSLSVFSFFVQLSYDDEL